MLHAVHCWRGTLLVAVVVCAGACARTEGVAAGTDSADIVTVSIVGTNDLHGGVLPDDGRGGLALLGGYVENLRAARARDGGAVLLVDAGDTWQGTMESNLSEGATVVAAYNLLGYSAAAIGNHEFDFGPVGPAVTPTGPDDDPRGALKARATEAHFPFLAANVTMRETGRPIDWPGVDPSVIVDAAGVPVGLIGVTTSSTLGVTMAANVRDLAIEPLAPTIAAEAEHLRADGAAVVVVAAHAGGACRTFDDPSDTSSCDPTAEIVAVANRLPPGLVDVIVAGHTHAGMAHEFNGIAIIESSSRGQAFGRVDLDVEVASGRPVARRIFRPQAICAFVSFSGACVPASRARDATPATYEGRAVAAHAGVERLLASVVADIETVKGTELGVFLETAVRRRGRVESPLGNLFIDAMLDAASGADVAVNNTDGGLRADLPAGALTYGELYEVIPFDNRQVELDLTGDELRRVFARQLSRSDNLIGVAGLRVEATCVGGAIDVALVRASGEAVRDDERLRVVTSDFLATGVLFRPVAPASGFTVPAGAPLIRDQVADALRRRGGPIRADDLVDEARPRWPSPDRLPIRCRVH